MRIFFRRGNNRGSGLTVLVDELIVTYALFKGFLKGIDTEAPRESDRA